MSIKNTWLSFFFGDDSLATIQDATNDLIKDFTGLNIKKEYNLNAKGVSHYRKARNFDTALLVRAVWVKEWTKKGASFLKKCVFLDNFGSDANIHYSRGWPARGSLAIV